MMLENIANLKESLNKIAQDVHGSDNESDGVDDLLHMYDRRNSHRFAHAKLISHSSTDNEIESHFNPEIEQYKEEIKRLQESEAEIKALSVNYASLLKEKEDKISSLNDENFSLKESVSEMKLSYNASKSDVITSINRPKVSGDRLVSRQAKHITQGRNHSGVLVQIKHDSLGNGTPPALDSQGIQSNNESNSKRIITKEKDLADLVGESQEAHGLLLELEKEGNNSEDVDLQVRDSRGLCESPEEENDSPKTKLEETRRDAVMRLETDLASACFQRDRALQELDRLKRHLLDKEFEESEKMDEDGKAIEELRADGERYKGEIRRLEEQGREAGGVIAGLQQELDSCGKTIDAKNKELLNLQTALGHYFAEIETRERLERDLAYVKHEHSKLSGLLEDARGRLEVSKAEGEEAAGKLAEAKRAVAEWRGRSGKTDDDNAKLRAALQQSIARVSRMSTDSDFFVDRRIVIKLLVTYLERHHSREVLELMARMLGFSEEDRARVGVAHHAKGTPPLGDAQTASIAHLWVDFLLKELPPVDG